MPNSLSRFLAVAMAVSVVVVVPRVRAEAGVYKRLRVPFVAPERREGLDEVAG